MENTIEEIEPKKLTYYQKMKNDPKYIENRRKNCLKYYHKIKNNEEYKQKVSEYKKQHYANKKDALLQIIL